MSKKYLMIIIGIIIIATAIYYIMGGFKKPTYSKQNDLSLEFYGQYYQGIVGSDSLETLFILARDKVKSNKTLDQVAIIYYGDINPQTGQVNNFIGFPISKESNFTEINGWEKQTLKAPSAVKACISANVLAMPTPDDMLSNMKEYASEIGMHADSIFIEYYAGPNDLCVQLLGK